jgi:hypothetical protein
MQNFTPEVLIQYLYNEASYEQTVAIEKALQYDWSLQEKVTVLRDSLNMLNSIPLRQPRRQSIAAIMDYARQTAEVEE